MRLARRCDCPTPRVFASDRDRCHRCGRLTGPPLPVSLIEALLLLAENPAGALTSRPDLHHH